jgi:hypothetical protein
VTSCGSLELFGLPGSGKTSLVQALLAGDLAGDSELAAPLVDGWAATPKSNLFRLLRAAPRDAATTVAHGLFADPLQACTGAGLRITSSCIRQRIAVRHASTTCLFHEGAANAAWRAQFRRGAPLSARYLASVLPASDAVVALRVDAVTARARIRTKRRRGPLNDLLAEAPVEGDTWDLAMACYQSVYDALGRSGRLYVIEDQPSVEDAAVRIGRLLDELRATGW